MQAPGDYHAFCRREILSTLNDIVCELNQTIIDMLLGQEQTYLAVDLADVNKADLEIAELPLEVL